MLTVIRISFAGALVSLSLTAQAEPYPSTYSPLPSEPVLIENATVLTGTGERLDAANIILRDGRIEYVGTGDVDEDINTLDAAGRWVTPGLIDVHSHLGVYPSPGTWAHSDGNEMINPATPNVWEIGRAHV